MYFGTSLTTDKPSGIALRDRDNVDPFSSSSEAFNFEIEIKKMKAETKNIVFPKFFFFVHL